MTQIQADRRAPLFFVSYAHPVLQADIAPELLQDNAVMQFFADLSIDVSELAGSDNGAYPGFIDTQMGGGQDWHKELLTAAGTCQVFIPLVSPNLIASQWCGKEWCVFAGRDRQRQDSWQGEDQTAILPIRWVPMRISALPKVVKEIQFFTPNLGASIIVNAYAREGLLGLIRMGQYQAYRTIVWLLAKRVVAISRACRVEPSDPDPKKLCNAFDDSRRS